MLKKLVIATAVLAASSTMALAAVGTPYVGAGLGVGDVSNKIQDNTDNVTVKNLAARNALLNIFGGYGVVVNQNIYLGGELFVNVNSAQSKITTPDGYYRVRMKTNYGISFIPGVMVGEHTMAYLRGGIVRASFNAVDNNTFTDSYASKNKSINGAQLGVGIQTSVAQNIDLRSEYVYSSYRSFNVGTTKVSPSSGQFNFSAVYKFD